MQYEISERSEEFQYRVRVGQFPRRLQGRDRLFGHPLLLFFADQRVVGKTQAVQDAEGKNGGKMKMSERGI